MSDGYLDDVSGVAERRVSCSQPQQGGPFTVTNRLLLLAPA